MITKFHNLLVIALVIIRHTHKAHRTDRGAENPTGPKLPDFTLSHCCNKKIIFVEPSCGYARHSCYSFSSVYVRASKFVQTITCMIMHGFQNNLAQLLPLRGAEVPFETFF